MPRIEKTIFISYRRTNVPWALAIYQNLTMHGYDVFFDYQSIDSGNFEKVILENIRARAHFLVILTPSALERCKEPSDWLRREIETAIDEKRNIVPLMLESFDFGSPLVTQVLTGKLSTLNQYNGLRVYSEYFFEAMDKLRERYLNVAVGDIALPALNMEAKGITATQKTAADEAPQVEKEELTALEWFERGYVFQEDKNFDEALRCYTESIRIQPDIAAKAHNNLGNLLRELKRHKEAEASFRKAIELDPADAIIYSNLGNLLRDLKRHEEAEASYRKVIELNPSYADTYSNLGNLLKDLKRYEEAEASYGKAIEINPAYANAYYNLGIMLDNLKRHEEAEVSCRKAIELNPSDANAYYNLGVILDNLKRHEEAEASFRKAIELNPSLAQAHYNLGVILDNLKRHEEAEASFRKAIELNPSDADAYSNLGLLLHEDLKRPEEAEASYRKAIELNPLLVQAYNNLVWLLRLDLKDRLEEVLPLLEKIIEINAKDFDAYLASVSISKQLGKDVSRDYIEKARQLIPEDDFYNRACLESICDNCDLAFEYLQKAAQKEKFNSTWTWEDPDLQWIRNDPRFEKIVGKKIES